MGRFLTISLPMVMLLSFVSGTSPDAASSHEVTTSKNRLARLIFDYVSMKYPGHDFDTYIYVGVKRQKLYLLSDTAVIDSYTISSSQYGIGAQKNSEKTPLGLHKIESMTGEEVPVSGIIHGKNYSGKRARIIKEAKKGTTDDVTTRAMRLEGLEKGVNKGGDKDSYERHIYIHGTPEEGLIGQPASHGCIRMINTEIIELYERVEKDTYVVILNN